MIKSFPVVFLKLFVASKYKEESRLFRKGSESWEYEIYLTNKIKF